MEYWGVKSYENDDAGDALDAGFDRVHGELYEELMDDRNPLSFEQVQKRLASSQTLDASIAALRHALALGMRPRGVGRNGAARLGRNRRPSRRAECAHSARLAETRG